jgi:hypothetical protein
MSRPAKTDPPRFCIVPAGLAQEAAAVLKPFAPVVKIKEVKLKFTISLEEAAVSFDSDDGKKRPENTDADWIPKQAIASVSSSAGCTFFECAEAAAVHCTDPNPCVSRLRVDWRATSSYTNKPTLSTVAVMKKLKQKAGSSAFDEIVVQITLYAANQKYRRTKDGLFEPLKPSQVMFKDVKQSGKEPNAPIVLGTPFDINLSVR